MEASALRALAALLVTVLLVGQAFRAPAGSNNRNSCWFGAAGFGLVALLNGLNFAQVDTSSFYGPLTVGIALLFAGSMWSLFMAYRSGEMQSQMQRMRNVIAKEQERREKRQ
ncbi:MAG: hypothetical protein MUD01_04325 [Chloroflexaceae bacterium]|nr:hypothetical protein [Chloroflexaceae bacterium]